MSTDIGARRQWSGDGIFSSGALTITELLERIPGTSALTAGWIASPQHLSYLGATERVRIFMDGVELQALDARNGGLIDLSMVQLWHLDDATIERAPGELRVHLRSWQTTTTTPLTRVDIGTGDLETNVYRGYLARRFDNGMAFQVGASQFGTLDTRNRGDADNLSIFARTGWARGKWSADAALLRTARDRSEHLRLASSGLPNLPKLKATDATSYVRGGYGTPEKGLWLQGIAATLKFSHPPDSALKADTTKFVRDSTALRHQYVLAGGYALGNARVSGTMRGTARRQQLTWSPSARIGYEVPRLAVSAFVERSGFTKGLSGDVSARVLPLSFLAVSGGVARYDASASSTAAPFTAARLEAGLRYRRLWVSGGAVRRDAIASAAPYVFVDSISATRDSARTGTFVTVRGAFWKDVGLEASATRFATSGAYLPQYQTLTRLYVDTDWLSRFPRRTFHFLAAATHEYRSSVPFPFRNGISQRGYVNWSWQMEIRLLQGTLFWQFRNVEARPYQRIPGLLMPRAVNLYGVRWNFVN